MPADKREPTWNLTAERWAQIARRVESSADVLEDGAAARVDDGVVTFYATPLNKPEGWRYPFTETLAGSSRPVAVVGRASHNPATGFVEFEMAVEAAVRALVADYEGGTSVLDELGLEQAAVQALAGTDSEREWLWAEFGRLVKVAGA